jgi:hypothetical protein
MAALSAACSRVGRCSGTVHDVRVARALSWWQSVKVQQDRASVVALTVANLLPLAGVLFLGWDAGAIVLLAWSENLIVGFYAVLRIALLKVEKPTHHLPKIPFIAFFCAHFGFFCAVHGAFILHFFTLGGSAPTSPGGDWPFPLDVLIEAWQRRLPGMEWQILCLFLSHGVSFVQNYMRGKERGSSSILEAMLRPYGRMVLMHVAVIAGGFGIVALGSPAPVLFVLVGLKLVVDLTLHKWSHRMKDAEGRFSHSKGADIERLLDSLVPRFLAALCLAAAVGSVGFAWHQHRKVVTSQPVEAVVVSSGVEEQVNDEGGTMYRPSVVYRYDVGGRSYTSSEIFPLTAWASERRETAERFVRPFAVEQSVEAYYNPEEPSRAFLLKRYSFLPYLFILVSAPLTVLFAARCLRDRVQWLSAQSQQCKALTVAAVWHGVGIAACGHYFGVSVRPYEMFPVVVAAIYEGLGLIPLAVALPKRGALGRLRKAFFAALVGALVGIWAGGLLGGFGGIAVGLISRGIFGRSVGGTHWAFYGLVGGAALGAALFGIATLVIPFETAQTPERTEKRRKAGKRSGRPKGR